MPDWLELELAHRLAPVEAPPQLTWQAPARPAQRRSFTLIPILAAAAAVALLLLAAPRGPAGVAGVNRYLSSRAGIDLPIPAHTRARLERARILEQGGVRVAAVTYRLDNSEATVLIARASAVRGPAWKPHGRTYAIACAKPHMACVLCHSNL